MLTKVENAVQVELAGEFELKGIMRPLAAYNVVAAVATWPWPIHAVFDRADVSGRISRFISEAPRFRAFQGASRAGKK